MKPTFYARFGLPIIILVAIMFPITVWVAVLALGTNRNDVKEWLPESFQATQDYHEFQRHFGDETFILLSWDGGTLDDERFDRLAQLLSPESPSSRGLFARVVTGRSLLERLTTPPTSVSESQAIARLRGSFVGPDGKQTAAALALSPAGQANLRAAVQTIDEVVTEQLGIQRGQLHMGGPPVDNVTIDLEGERMLLQLMLLCGGVGVTLAWWYLRDVRLTLMVFVGGVYSAAICLAIVYALGGEMNSVLLTMPAVVYTAGLSTAIHLINYYRHVRAQEGLHGAAERGVKAGWIPCMLSSATTAIGLISLCISDLIPIRNFGFYTALGLMVTLAFMFAYLPSALSLWPPALHKDLHDGDPSALDPQHRRRMRILGTRIVARPSLVIASFLVAMVVCGAGLYRVNTTINLMSLFAADAPIIKSYEWLERKLGPLVPMEVVIRIDPQTTNLSMVERMELVQRVQRSIESIDHVSGLMSAATFAPDLSPPRRAGLRGVLLGERSYRAVLNRRLEANREDFREYLTVDPETGEELWRISMRVAALAGIDYGDFIFKIQDQVEPLLQNERQRGAQGIVGVTYTGLTPVVYMAERALLNGLTESFFSAFVMIATVMSVVFRDVRAGLFTMLPNVFPMAVVFGVMSWAGIALDIGTMMTASVAMGVCVDDTVHYVNWFRRATRLGLNRHDATVLAFENAAGALYQSTAIVSLGLLTFALSTFMPTRRFGLLMFTLLSFGLLADLMLGPAMLTTRLGKVFTIGCRPQKPPAEGAAEAPASGQVEIADR